MLPGSTNMCKTRMSARFGSFAHPAIGQTPVFFLNLQKETTAGWIGSIAGNENLLEL